MDIERAKELLTALSDGIDPLTGELLPETDSCNRVEIVRALNVALRFMDSHTKKKQSPKNAGLPWTKEDEEMLRHMYNVGYTKEEICDYFGRSINAIAARLVQLGEIDNRDEFRKWK